MLRQTTRKWHKIPAYLTPITILRDHRKNSSIAIGYQYDFVFSSFMAQTADYRRNNKTSPSYNTLRAHGKSFIGNHFHQRLDHNYPELAHLIILNTRQVGHDDGFAGSSTFSTHRSLDWWHKSRPHFLMSMVYLILFRFLQPMRIIHHYIFFQNNR